MRCWQERRGESSKSKGMRRRLPLAAAGLAVLASYAVPATAGGAPHHSSSHVYDVTITRTEYGIPHIVGKDFGSVGYGYGYAFAQDNLCAMAETYVTVNGERSRWFGPDGARGNRGGSGI